MWTAIRLGPEKSILLSKQRSIGVSSIVREAERSIALEFVGSLRVGHEGFEVPRKVAAEAILSPSPSLSTDESTTNNCFLLGRENKSVRRRNKKSRRTYSFRRSSEVGVLAEFEERVDQAEAEGFWPDRRRQE